jgi:hypothetical protein
LFVSAAFVLLRETQGSQIRLQAVCFTGEFLLQLHFLRKNKSELCGTEEKYEMKF